MVSYLGDFVKHSIIYVMFNTFTSDDPSASSTITDFVNTDVHIHKDDNLTQRNNAAGITVSVNFDGITGSHMIKIDTDNETVARFWEVGHDYFVRIEGATVDAATLNVVVAHFSIENRNNFPNTELPRYACTYEWETSVRYMKGAGIQFTHTDPKSGYSGCYDWELTEWNTSVVNSGMVSTYPNKVDTQIESVARDLDNTTDGLSALKTLIDAIKAETATIVNDTDVIDDGTSGLVKIAQDVAAILVDTAVIGALGSGLTAITDQTDLVTAARMGALTDWIDGGRLDLLLDAIKVITDALTAAAATKLALSAGTIVTGIVSWDNTNATTTVFYSDDITEATADHFNGRIVIFTSGALQYQATDITDYALVSSEGKFTVTALTEAPADNVTFVIV